MHFKGEMAHLFFLQKEALKNKSDDKLKTLNSDFNLMKLK